MAPRSPSVDPEELALVARANAGEAAAFEALFRRQRDWALALARRFGGDADDAAEVVQETFVSTRRTASSGGVPAAVPVSVPAGVRYETTVQER